MNGDSTPAPTCAYCRQPAAVTLTARGNRTTPYRSVNCCHSCLPTGRRWVGQAGPIQEAPIDDAPTDPQTSLF